jgi:anti-sigma-K factor RskA
MQQQVDTMGQRQRLLAFNLERYRQEAEMMAQPGMQPIVMQSIVKDHPMAATFYWNKTKGEAYVSIQKLPPAPAGMQYQLWAIADGKPVDIGMLENDVVAKGGMQKVPKAVVNGQAFAISLEKAGGSSSPTADKIYVMGKMPA